MSSLLSPFSFGQQKQSYFQVKLTIHELASVPLVTGYFHVKWRFKNVHSITSHAHATLGKGHPHHHSDKDHVSKSPKSAKSPSLQNSPEKKSVPLPEGDESAGDEGKGKEQEQAGCNVEAEEEEELLRDADHPEADESTETLSRSTSTKRHNGGHRFLSGMANALHLKKAVSSRKQDEDSTSTPNTPISPSSAQDSPSSSKHSVLEGEGDPPLSASTTGSFPSVTSDDSVRKSFASSRHTLDSEIGDQSISKYQSKSKGKGKEKAKEHHSQSPHSFPHKPNFHHANHSSSSVNKSSSHAEPRGETNSARVYEHVVKWERTVETGIRINIEKPRVASGSSARSNVTSNEKSNVSSSVASNSGVDSSANSVHSREERHGGGLSQKSSRNDLRAREKDDRLRESSSTLGSNTSGTSYEEDETVREAWGALAKSELRLSVKQVSSKGK